MFITVISNQRLPELNCLHMYILSYLYPVYILSYYILPTSCPSLYPILHVSCLNTVLPISDPSISYPALFCLCPVLYVSCLYPVLPAPYLSISCPARILPTPILPVSCLGLRLNTGRSDKGTQVSITFQRNMCQ